MYMSNLILLSPQLPDLPERGCQQPLLLCVLPRGANHPFLQLHLSCLSNVCWITALHRDAATLAHRSVTESSPTLPTTQTSTRGSTELPSHHQQPFLPGAQLYAREATWDHRSGISPDHEAPDSPLHVCTLLDPKEREQTPELCRTDTKNHVTIGMRHL